MMDDPELQELFTDPAHQEVVDLLKVGRPGTPPVDPNFRSYLRAKLMTEAERTLPRQAGRPWFGLNFKPRALALSMAAVAAGFLVVLGVQVYLRNSAAGPSTPVAADVHLIDNKTNVAAAVEPIQISFSGPVDKNAVAESVQIEPATAVTKQWVGQTLVIIPQHPLAPNTTYTVRLQPSAVPPASPAPSSKPTIKPSPAVVPTPVVVHFSTVRAPIPPVVPPSYKSSNLTYGHDNRLGDAGTILNAVWTNGGQILATRPAGQPGPGEQATASATATASASASASPASAAATDVWLLTPDGKPIRMVAQSATLPSAPASGNQFAAWAISNGQAQLVVRDLQGNPVATVATINGTPQRPATWIGTDRLAYLDNDKALKVVDLHGTAVQLPDLKVSGSVETAAGGTLLAVESSTGSVVLDLTQPSATPTALPAGATAFDWSTKGDLAFVVQQPNGSDLYVAGDGKQFVKIARSQNGETWSDLNWSPDANSLLLATHPAGSNSTATRLLVINRDGSNVVGFGAFEKEYSAPEWAPAGDLVLFTRRDDATGGTTFQVATVSTTGGNGAEQQALSEVNNFMNARIEGNGSGAQAELDSNGQAAYSKGATDLLSPSGLRFVRYYPVTVQLLDSSPSRFLIGVRTFLGNASGSETGFFEEQLTVLQQGQRYFIHDVVATPIESLSHGPTVVSLEVLPVPGGQQVRVRFDADLKAESVSSNSIEIKDASGNAVRAQLSFDPDGHLATLVVHLRPGTYQLVVSTGVTDINGMPMAQDYDAPLVISR